MIGEIGQGDYVRRIEQYTTHDELFSLWQAIAAKDTPGWPQEEPWNIWCYAPLL